MGINLNIWGLPDGRCRVATLRSSQVCSALRSSHPERTKLTVSGYCSRSL